METSNQFPQVAKNQNPKSCSVCAREIIRQTLSNIFLLVSIRVENIPDKEEFSFLVNYIQRSLGKWQPSDLINAHTMYIQGKLDTEVKHFGNYTSEFLEEVMRSYSRSLSIQIKKDILLLPEPTIRESEKDKFLHDRCLVAFEEYKNGIEFSDGGNAKYNWLDAQGFIPFNPDRKKVIFEAAIRAMKSELSIESIKKPNNRQAIESMLQDLQGMDFQSKAICKAKQIALNIFFSELVEAGVELSEII